ncbi:uncharacterized protein AMSG_11799 [Thecamonas trahens ATCC 50062]|uniref:Phosphoenolpyruvate synthase n=1 Tax=Thecamonas trahens ATCC 50062 TaxID=461836 RepID=A0A0L0D9M7_THETB|nr:hypothetical protein AMSG_11799 [Thecamonas trahens ATCC 50062]KNC47998.1 hypothetical protein AMSG_11799 [Thecamonas trahens ATCC 50062]|eukprot:XP_013759117.1 hypothetical protein AMSG_11799 [Thecamonas trahens ATCC 50062]
MSASKPSQTILQAGQRWEGTLVVPGFTPSPYVIDLVSSTAGRHYAYGQAEYVVVGEEAGAGDGRVVATIADSETACSGHIFTDTCGRTVWRGSVVQAEFPAGGSFELVLVGEPDRAAAVVDLNEAAGMSVDELGGKGLRCVELSAVGVPVPLGCVVTASAYQAHMASPELAKLRAAAKAKLGARLASSKEALEALQAAIVAHPLDPAVAAAVGEWIAGAGGDSLLASGVAVRSSGVGEDGASASHAGIYETYLNVKTVDGVLVAIKKAWASAWHPRAFAYHRTREAKVAAADATSMAVVVMTMVPAAAAGVLFTVDPMNAAAPRARIEAVWGLGESLVSASVTPASFVFDWLLGKVVESELGAQVDGVFAVAAGGTEVRNVSGQGPPLTEAQVCELVQLGLNVAKHYGRPQDIEWALQSSGALVVLQTRPITTLSSATAVTGGNWYPFLFDYLGLLTQSLQGDAHSRLLLTWGSQLLGWAAPHHSFGQVYARHGLYAQLENAGVLDTVRDQTHVEIQAWLDAASAADGDLPWARGLATDELVAAGLAHTCAVVARLLPLYITVGSWSWASGLLAGHVLAQLREELGDAPAQAYLAAIPSVTGGALAALRSLGADLAAAVAPAELEALVASPSALLTHPASAKPLSDILARFAWMSDDDQDLGSDTHWGDHPQRALDALASMLTDEPPAAAPKPEPTPVFGDNSLASALAVYVRLKEEIHVATSEVGYAVFKAARALGALWVNAGLLETADDVFELPASLLAKMVSVHDSAPPPVWDALVGNAQAHVTSAKMFQRVPRPSWLMPNTDMLGQSSAGGASAADGPHAGGAGLISGRGLAGGRASGRAFVARDLDAAQALPHGAILVTARTTAGWTPLFSRLAGVVVEVGGLLSHTAIVAREMGLPVVCIPDAMARLATDDVVVVDGSGGAVMVVPPDSVPRR